MAASGGLVSESADVSQWLKNLPLAPEYHPTLAEFQDPIAYIFKIEKEAANFGICKIVPPVLSAPKKTALANLNRSLVARSASKTQPTFTTRQQQIGFCPRKPRPVQKPVWQSGDDYTFQEFEAKAKAFEKNYLKKCSKKASLSPLEIETLYWKATVDKPFSVEYANDMPGSAFSPRKSGGKEMGEGLTVGETEWNMRGVSRAKGSLLRFMKEEIPGVTSPMVYIAMMFSWFAWHVEDHDLHSLNYLHMGAGKTWYGVPREAAVAFEDVVRVHGYGGEINPLVTFSVLGEKTTIMSPEVFVSAGVPCCRLVQNAGEFVVTFPRAYHSGFSHGFNCGEAANIATPEWLKVAKDAAIRRASINYPPMVSHFQLLYDLALELCTRVPMSIGTKPRSSRLKNKQKDEGDTLVKRLFVENIVHNNDLLHKLGKGSSVVLLPRCSSDISVSLGFCRNKGIMKSSESSVPYETVPDRSLGFSQVKGPFSMKTKFTSQCDRSLFSSLNGFDPPQNLVSGTENEGNGNFERLSDQTLFSCATCGILSFDCIAIIQPREAAVRYLMAADCSFFNDWIVGPGVTNDGFTLAGGRTNTCEQNPFLNQKVGASYTKLQGDTSALSLLASNYANSSDSEDEMAEPFNGENNTSDLHSFTLECHEDRSGPANFNDGSDIKHRSSVVHDTEFKRVVLREDKQVPFSRKSDKDSSSMHVFCLEHAVEVEERFCRIGGVNILLLCHPEYPKIEAEAKLVSEELGIDYSWNYITFHDATKEDEENIQSAFDSEEAISGNGDWSVKMGINIFYSANLSRSSLYSKQMPYNSVIYNAFGYTSPSSSPSQFKVYGRQRKVVVGRWCGKVWMSNQVHPLLIKRDSEDRDYENEQDRSFNGWSIADEKFERKPKKSCNSKTTLAATKLARKRKKAMISGQTKKVKCHLAGDEGVTCKPDIRVYSRKQRKHIQSEVSSDSLKYGRDGERKYEASDNSLEGNVHQRNRRFLRSKTAKYNESDNDVTYGQKKKYRFSKQANNVERESEISDGSLDGDIHDRHRRFPRRMQNNFFERENAVVSDDSLEQSFLGRVCRRKRNAYNVKDDENSNDSEEYSSLKHSPRISGGSEAKYINREDDISDDSIENSDWRSLRTLKGKKAKFVERKDAISDCLLESNIHCQPRIPKSKRTKFFEREDAILDEFPEDNVFLKHLRIPRIKDKKLEQEDVSDDLRDDNGRWQLRKASRTKRIARETISNDSEEEDNDVLDEKPHWHSRKISVSKQTKVMEMEDAVSQDSMEEDHSSKYQRMNLRSKHRKIVPKVKQQRAKPKQENGKNQQQHVEEELEGGPSTRLRQRPSKPPKEKLQNIGKRIQTTPSAKPLTNTKNAKNKYKCDIEGCTMSFGSKQELALHKRNICPVKGCGKTFFSHKYLVQHRRVHCDDRPLKCPWKGCKMAFKWAWARTEHIRVHTGARPYVCAEEGCGQTFRFVSDFSRHKRKTGHSVKKNIA